MARVRISLGCLLLVVAIGCATIDETSSIKPNERPALATMEGGLWMQIDNIEKKFKRSGWVVRDAALNSYINKIVCDLAGSFCPDFRVYIVSVPAFNATMAPNGMMQVYTDYCYESRMRRTWLLYWGMKSLTI